MRNKYNHSNNNIKMNGLKYNQQAKIFRLHCFKKMIFLYETHFRFKDNHRMKLKGRKTIYCVNSNHKRAGVAILI